MFGKGQGWLVPWGLFSFFMATLLKGQFAENIVGAAFPALHLDYRMLDIELLPEYLLHSLANVSGLTGEEVIGKYVAALSPV